MKYRCHEKNPLREGGGYLGERYRVGEDASRYKNIG